MTDYLVRLAAFARGTRLADLPASTVAAAKLVQLDTLPAIVDVHDLGALLAPAQD
jgi:hypothetical protein